MNLGTRYKKNEKYKYSNTQLIVIKDGSIQANVNKKHAFLAALHYISICCVSVDHKKIISFLFLLRMIYCHVDT